MERERFILSLLHLRGVGRKTAWKTVRSVTRVPASISEMYEDVRTAVGMPPKLTRDEVEQAWCAAEGILETCDRLCIRVWAATHPDFPTWVCSIPDPPLILFLKGNTECVRTPISVAVIGTREPTEHGRQVAHRFGMRAAEAGCVVVSGLALGCDSEAHRGCLDAKGRAVAVLAHGLDRVYPRESEGLANEVLEKGGCWVSEYPPGARAQRSYFVERDRLQSALSGGIIVTETDVDGGTMHTVRFAEAQQRFIACLVHPQELSGGIKARGNALLLREKRAEPLATKDDLTTFIQRVREHAARLASATCNHPAATNPPTSGKHLFSEEDDGRSSV